MLKLDDITFTIGHDEDETDLLHKITLDVTPGHFMAIVGPSGCGKTTLLKLVAGINEHTEGSIYWNGRDLEKEGDLEPSEVAYVPQFSIAYDELTVYENIESAVKLRVRTKRAKQTRSIVARALRSTGMERIRHRPVKVLSGGQKRRLALAMELVANPQLLLCDEVTSGLDPKSEREIVRLLYSLSRSEDRVVLNVTHSLCNLELYDSVLVLHEGKVVYHGPPRALRHYFTVDSAEDIYPRLAKRDSMRWFKSWEKNRKSYYALFPKDEEKEEDKLEDPREETTTSDPEPASQPPKESIPKRRKYQEEVEEEEEEEEAQTEDLDPEESDKKNSKPKSESNKDDFDDEEDEEDDAEEEEEFTPDGRLPGLIKQVTVLFGRRWKILTRDKGQMILQLAMLLGFPVLVYIFAIDGIEPLKQLSDTRADNIVSEMSEQTEVRSQNLKVGGLVSGLIMFQVVLLTLMGSNNSAREIAGERAIYEKERFAGLRPSAYLISKILFLAVLVGAQAFWMAVFVELMTGFLPGDFETRLILLIMVNAAMTAICLGISATMKSSEQASLLSIYLVGFQLPLSGAVLALPKLLEPIIQPFISAYWAWSGSLSSMKETAFYDAVEKVTETSLQPSAVCIYVLGFHILIGLIIAFIGCRKSQWN